MEKDYEKLLLKMAASIKHLRKQRNITQEQMVDFGFNYRFFQKIESGRYSPNLFTLHRLAKTFKVKVQDHFC